MLIELWRKEVATDYSITSCVICGNDFELGTVYPVVAGDQGQEMGEMCPTCLGYLGRRRQDSEDPTLGNWPAREWPTLEDLQEARRRYPSAMFETRAALAGRRHLRGGREDLRGDYRVEDGARDGSLEDAGE